MVVKIMATVSQPQSVKKHTPPQIVESGIPARLGVSRVRVRAKARLGRRG